jgi:hypothetical protein
MSKQGHVTRVDVGVLRDKEGRQTRSTAFRAACSCGWVSPQAQTTRSKAEQDEDDHVVAVGSDGDSR